MAEKTAPEVNPEAAQAEEHVAEVMGPAQQDTVAQETSPITDAAAEPVVESGVVPSDAEDVAIDSAVEDTMRSDATVVLPGETELVPVVMHESFAEKCKRHWFEWWADPRKKYSMLLGLISLIVAICIIPVTQAALMNLVGIRSSLIMTITDRSTSLPLKGATITVDGKQVKTGESGQVRLRGLHVGKQHIVVHKLGFADYKKDVKLGVRVIDLGEISLRAVGAQLTYTVSDLLSGKPVKDVAFTSGEAFTKSDSKGRAILTLEPTEAPTVKVTITYDGYRTEKLTQPQNRKSVTMLKLVPSAPEVYLSKKSGKYSVYRVDIDGKNEKVLLPGTGLESQNTRLMASPDGRLVVVVSTRENKRNLQGYLLSTLTLVDTVTGDYQTIEQAEQITLVGWRNKTIVFQETMTGASAANPNRQKIFAYNTDTNDKKQLASANHFNDFLLVGNGVLYTISATDLSTKDTVVRIGTDGSGKRSFYTGDVWSMVRVDYKTFKIQTPTKWLQYSLGATKLEDTTPPNDYASRNYTDSNDGDTSLWVDQRDSLGLLMKYDVATDKETTLAKQKYMQQVVGWLSPQAVVFRVSNANETADYVVSTEGGQPIKVADVSNLPLSR